jgi:hypothetical protein
VKRPGVGEQKNYSKTQTEREAAAALKKVARNHEL